MAQERFRFKSLYAKGKKPLPYNIKTSEKRSRPETDSLVDWINFYLYKEVFGIESPHTARAKVYDLHKLTAFFEYSNITSIAFWDKAITSSFVEALEKEYEVSSVYRTFATITNFVSFLILHEAIKPIDNPTTGIRLRDQELPAPQGVQLLNKLGNAPQLTSQEIYQLLLNAGQSLINDKITAEKKSRALPYRNLAIIAALYGAGLRVDEICGITISQLDQIPVGGMWLRNVKCKGKRVRKAYLKADAVALLLQYIDKERGWGQGYVFQSANKQKLDQSTVWRILQKIAARAQEGLPAGTRIDIHPHSLRHERGYNLHRAGVGDAMIAQALGHAGTGQVARYSRRSEEDEAELLKDI